MLENGSLPLWNSDNDFIQIMKKTSGRTLVDVVRCYVIYQICKQVTTLFGEIAEVGVYKGGTAKLISVTSPNKKIFIFDTFEGMPETKSGVDLHKQGDFNDCSEGEVLSFLSDCNNIVCKKGLFPESATSIQLLRFSFVHIDVDIYQSVKDCCSFFYSRMVSCGVMLFDDYGFPTCPGAKKAVDEFFSDKKEQPIYLPTGQCLVVKL